MDGKNIRNKWNSSTTFIIAMVGAIIGLNGIWRFSYLVYENGGGTFLIPYIIAIVLMAVPFLVLELGIGVKFKSSLPKVFFNIKEEFEILGWFIVFLIFMVLVYYTCILGWDLVYVILSLFKGWGSNPSVFFTNTLLHSTSDVYGLTYLVVPVGIALLFIWGLIYFISKRDINEGIANACKIGLVLSLILIIGLIIYAVQLPGSRTGIMALFNPNWDYLFDSNLWFTAFGQLIFSYGLGYGIATTYSSYLDENTKLIDSAWLIVLMSLFVEVLFSILVFAILGFMAFGNNMAIPSLGSDGFSLIFVVLPTAFKIMGPWVYFVAPAFFLILVIVGITAAIALINPLAQSISEKFSCSRERAIKNLIFIGLFASFIFATGMGEYLLKITDSFISHFAIILALLFEVVVIAWAYDLDALVNLLNKNSFIKIDKFWIITIKFLIPIILIVLWISGVYDLIISGNRTVLFVESIIATLFVLVPLALTVIPASTDYYLEFNTKREAFNYFKGRSDSNIDDDEITNLETEDNSKDKNIDLKAKNKSNKKNSEVSDKSFGSRFRLSKDKVDELFDSEESNQLFDEKGSFLDPFKFGRSKENDKNVLKNVDLSSSEFDSVKEKEAKLKDKDDKLNGSGEDDLDKLINSLSDDTSSGTEDLDDDFEVIEVEKSNSKEISNEKLGNLDDVGMEDNKKQHKFKKSEDFDINLEDNNKSNKTDKSKIKSKSKPNVNSNKSKPKAESKSEELEYEEFSDDFFDDGIFGDEGYESLLDDYVAPKTESKSENVKNKPKSLKRKVNDDEDNEDKYYDFEGKGADSVFNLDD